MAPLRPLWVELHACRAALVWFCVQTRSRGRVSTDVVPYWQRAVLPAGRDVGIRAQG